MDEGVRDIIVKEIRAELEHLVYSTEYYEEPDDSKYYMRMYEQLQRRHKRLTGHEYYLGD
jgi:hypothetical protein